MAEQKSFGEMIGKLQDVEGIGLSDVVSTCQNTGMYMHLDAADVELVDFKKVGGRGMAAMACCAITSQSANIFANLAELHERTATTFQRVAHLLNTGELTQEEAADLLLDGAHASNRQAAEFSARHEELAQASMDAAADRTSDFRDKLMNNYTTLVIERLDSEFDRMLDSGDHSYETARSVIREVFSSTAPVDIPLSHRDEFVEGNMDNALERWRQALDEYEADQ